MTSAAPSSASPNLNPRVGVAAAATVIVLGSAWAYATSFQGVFVFDDLPSIVENAGLRHGWPWLAGSPDGANTLTVGGRPVVNLTFALNYALSGTAVWSYHAVNLLVHMLAGLVLFGVVRRTLARLERYRGSATELAGGIALLWAVHPLQTEAVTYIVQRTESLMGLFYLLTLYCFIRFTEKSGRSPWFWLTVTCCLLGAGTKEVIVTAPIIVLLYDRSFVAGTFRAAWKLRRGLYLSLAATWLPLAGLVASTGGTRGGTAGFGVGLTPWTYALTQAWAIPHYLRLAVWPHPLVFDYGTAVVTEVRALLGPGLLICFLLGATALALWRRLPLGFLGAWFFLTLAPSSSVVPVATQTVAEHRMYLALAAIVALVVLGLYRALGRRIWLGVACLALVLSFATRHRNEAYRSLVSLWGDTAAADPTNDRAHDNFGLALVRARRPAEGMAELREALRLNPENAEAHNALGDALCQEGHPAEGIAQFEAALRIQPDFADARNNLGKTLAETGRGAEGMAQLRTAMRENPYLLAARINLANALLAAGQMEEAEVQARAALRLDPGSAAAHHDLGCALVARAGREREARAEFEAALRIDPAQEDAEANLGMILAKAGQFAEAVPHFLAALRLKPDRSETHSNLGITYAQSGRMPEAAGQFAEAVRLKPADIGSRRNLALALIQLGRLPEAVAQFEELVRLAPDDAQLRQNLAELKRAGGL